MLGRRGEAAPAQLSSHSQCWNSLWESPAQPTACHAQGLSFCPGFVALQILQVIFMGKSLFLLPETCNKLTYCL